MKRSIWGAGLLTYATLIGCGGNDTEPGSKVSGPSGGSGGSGGSELDLALEAGKGGGGAGGAAGGGGQAGGVSGGGASGATTTGGAGSGAGGGSSAGSGGSGGAMPAGMCMRAAASDADCADFWGEEGYTRAHSCTDRASASRLASTLGKECASVNFVAGSMYGACCQP